MAGLRSAREACGSSIRDGPCDSLSAAVYPADLPPAHWTNASESWCGKPGGLASRSRERVQRALAYIDAHLGERLTLAEIANELKLSPYHFAHVFKRLIGIAPHQYVMQQRLERAKRLLAHTNLSIAAIAVELGYASQSHFSEAFHHATGVTPLTYRLSR